MMKFEVRVGDALSMGDIPTLVVPANKQLSLGWGSHIAEAVLKAAGKGVEDETLTQAPSEERQDSKTV